MKVKNNEGDFFYLVEEGEYGWTVTLIPKEQQNIAEVKEIIEKISSSAKKVEELNKEWRICTDSERRRAIEKEQSPLVNECMNLGNRFYEIGRRISSDSILGDKTPQEAVSRFSDIWDDNDIFIVPMYY